MTEHVFVTRPHAAAKCKCGAIAGAAGPCPGEVKVKVEVEVVVPEDWLEYAEHSDLLSTDYSGYWAFGVERDDKLGWLIYAGGQGDHGEAGIGARPGPKSEKLALERWRSGGVLPKCFYKLDREALKKAFAEGCKRWGVDWMDGEHGDAVGYDVVVKLALLGEIVYG